MSAWRPWSEPLPKTSREAQALLQRRVPFNAHRLAELRGVIVAGKRKKAAA